MARYYIGLVVIFTVTASLGFDSFKCKTVKIKLSLFTSLVVIKISKRMDMKSPWKPKYYRNTRYHCFLFLVHHSSAHLRIKISYGQLSFY